MRKVMMLVLLGALCAGVAALSGCGGGGTTGGGGGLLDLINDLRVAQGRTPLESSSAHATVAQNYAVVLEQNEVTPPVYRNNLLSGFPSTQLTSAGVTFTVSGETGVEDYADSLPNTTAAFNRLNQSTLLNTSFTRAGTGFVEFICAL